MVEHMVLHGRTNIVAHTRTAYLEDGAVPSNNSYTATPDQHNRVVPLYPPSVLGEGRDDTPIPR